MPGKSHPKKRVLFGGNFLSPIRKARHSISLGEGCLLTASAKRWHGPHCTRAMNTTTLPPSSLVLFSQGVVWIYPLLRVSTEHILIVRGLRAGVIDQTAPHVSIISNRASNSCPQAVQRIQSDSTVNSSDLIPMPPQSGQRARWTL